MPAIQPALLRRQAALLSEYFDQPDAFVRSLHHFLEFYADRSRRPGQGGTVLPLLEAYHVKPPVLRQIVFELDSAIAEFPGEILSLCDALWDEPYLEFRSLAIMILGRIPPNPTGEITQRIDQWLSQHPEGRILNLILEVGSKRLRNEEPKQFLTVAIGWLGRSDPAFQQVGLRAILLLVEDPGFENFPIVFNSIQPLVLSAPAYLRPDILDLIKALAIRSPKEAAYFLRQQLTIPDQVDVPYLIRQSARSFPEDIRERLLNQVRIKNVE